LFNRPKDWVDIEAIISARADFDAAYVLRWLDDMVGPEDSARRRFAALLELTSRD
jgi:hypothetical protein